MYEEAQLRNVPLPPMPADLLEQRRWLETRRRRRMLYGLWRQDLLERLKLQVGGIRQEAWGEPDLSSNVFRASFTALAVLYDRQPLVHHDQAVGAAKLVAIATLAGLWSMLQRHQRDTLGMREMLMAVDAVVVRGRVELRFRPVTPDQVVITASPDDPTRPIRIAELRLRRNPATKLLQWVWEVWDITDPANPVHVLRDAARGEEGPDVSADFGVEPGWPDRFRRQDGSPVLPYVLRHASSTGDLWDTYEAIELVDGSLNCAVLWTFFGHCMRDASFPQRWAVGVMAPSSQEVADDPTNQRDFVVTDPGALFIMQVNEDAPGGQPQIGQWEAGADPEKMQEGVALYERRVAAYAGIAPSDVQRVAGDPRSGFAIALNQEAQREAQRRYEPVFRPADEELLALAAIVANRVGGTDFPEEGYRVAYQGLPPSPDERQADRDQADWEIANDLASPIDVYVRTHPGATIDDAIEAIVRARLDKLLLQDRFEKEAKMLGLNIPMPPPAAPTTQQAMKLPPPPPGAPDAPALPAQP